MVCACVKRKFLWKRSCADCTKRSKSDSRNFTKTVDTKREPKESKFGDGCTECFLPFALKYHVITVH